MTFIAEALKGRNTGWIWYITGIVCIAVAFLAGQSPMYLVVKLRLAHARISQVQAEAFYQTGDFAHIGIGSTPGLILLLAPFVAGLVALCLYVSIVHKRKVRSLVAVSNVRWRRIVYAFALWFLLSAAAEVVMYVYQPEIYEFRLDWKKWILLMPVVCIILPLQTLFEEVLMRGYLLQRIGITIGRPIVAVVVTALLFGLLHGANPEIREYGVVVMMCYYISIGIFLAVITVLSDGLELAIGMHTATNVYGAGFVTYAGSALQTDALVRVSQVDPVIMLIFAVLSMLVFTLIIHRRYSLRKITMLFEHVDYGN